MSESLAGHLREKADRVTRYVEEPDTARAPAGLAREGSPSRLAAQIKERVQVWSVVTGPFVPSRFISDLPGLTNAIPENCKFFLHERHKNFIKS